MPLGQPRLKEEEEEEKKKRNLISEKSIYALYSESH